MEALTEFLTRIVAQFQSATLGFLIGGMVIAALVLAIVLAGFAAGKKAGEMGRTTAIWPIVKETLQGGALTALLPGLALGRRRVAQDRLDLHVREGLHDRRAGLGADVATAFAAGAGHRVAGGAGVFEKLEDPIEDQLLGDDHHLLGFMRHRPAPPAPVKLSAIRITMLSSF